MGLKKLIRALIDGTVNIVGMMRKNRKIEPNLTIEDGRVCVNLGCGLTVANGWTNIDASLNAMFAGAPKFLLESLYKLSGSNRYFSKNEYCRLLSEYCFIFHDLSRSLPFSEKSVDVFYSSHFFEHIFKVDAMRLLQEMRVALRDGGVIRIAIPDLAHAVDLYFAGRKKEMLEDYFFVNDRSSYLACHKYMYDFELLKSLLEEAGYRDITRCAYREGATPDITILDKWPDITLFVEAYR